MQASTFLILSNQVGELADALKRRLFFSGGHPFERRFIIVPSLTIKRFLLMRFAEDADLGIATGIEIYTLSQAIRELFDQPGRKIPSRAELSFEIGEMISQLYRIIKEKADDRLLAPLFAYVAEDKQRIGEVSEELALLFARYGRQESTFLDAWLKEEGWQQFLWKKIFYPGSPRLKLCEAVESASPPPFAIHLFHFSTLPKLFLNFFMRCQANYYLLSPSSLFWGDLCSDREKASLHKMLTRRGAKAAEKNSLDEFMRDQNPFLANLSKVGRDFFNQLLDEDPETEELYVEEPETSSLLQKIRRDFFAMHCLDGQEALSPEDQSIQLHTSASRWREVEALYDALVKILDGHAETRQPIFAKDILVLAPDISAYLPYIQAVFGSKISRLAFAVHDLPHSIDSVFIQGIQMLLAVSARRFDLDSVFMLFSLPSFQKKFALAQADIALFRRWVEQANIHWGVDAEQRKHFLHEESTHGTWEAGFERLLLGLAMLTSEDEVSHSTWPLPIVDKSEVEKLGILIRLIRSLKDDLDPILTEKKMSVRAWLVYLNCLGESYFACAEEEKRLLQEIDELAHASAHLTTPVSFQRVIKVLQKHLFTTQGSSYSGPHLDVVHFGNMQEGAALPARVICLLGMEEGAFPRVEENHSLCALTAHPIGKSLPKRAEEDRYLFLQLLLCAGDYLLLSCQRLSPQDGKPLAPSIVVQELQTYVKKIYGAEIKIDHPALPKTFADKKKQKPFIADFPLLLPERAELSIVIELSDLRKLAKNPLQFYFQKNLGFSLPWEVEEKEFSLSALERSLLQKSALQQPLDSLLQKAEAKGVLPFGHFKELMASQLTREMDERNQFLSEQALSSEEIFEVELNVACKMPEGRTATVVGKMNGVTHRGLVVHGKKSFSELVRIWPELLLFTQLPFSSQSEVSIFFLKDKKRFDIHLPDPIPLLQKYLNYYEVCLKNPSPLFHDWTEALLRGTEEELEKKIAACKGSNGFLDPYRDWLFTRDPLPSAKNIYQTWSPLLRDVFEEVSDAKL